MKTTYLCLAFFLFIFSCKEDKSEPETSGKIDINGTWVATGYECPSGVQIPNEVVKIVESNGKITATKTVGDPCVPAGNVTFAGTYDETAKLYQVKWTTGTSSSPASENFTPGTVTVIDKDNLTSTFIGQPSVTFKRQ